MSLSNNYPVTLPSLSLDFANTKQLDSRITFTRASTATFYNGITTAKAEENLFQRSQEFEDSYWSKTRVTATANTEVAPDGTTTADTITQVAGQTVSGSVGLSITVGAGSHTQSVFAKPNGKNFLIIQEVLTGAGTFTWFNLSTGAVGTTGAGITAAITASTNGFYRCSITYTVPSAVTNAVRFYVADSDNSTTVADSGGLFLWGAQLEQRSAVTAYTLTTTQPITNYIPALQTAAANVARFEHNPITGESLGLEIEEQRANLLLQSEDLDTTWSETRATLNLNSVIAPNGTLTADRLIASTDNDTHFTTQTFTGTAAAHTYSAYAKAGGLNHVALRLFNGATQVGLAYYNLSTGATGTVTAGTASIQNVGNGWYRCILTATLAASASCTADIYLASADNTNSFVGNAFDGVSLWGAQLEAGAFPTSYIPTVASQVTRSADSATMTGTNFSSWYNQGEGTVYAEALVARQVSSGGTGIVNITDQVSSSISLYYRGSGTTGATVSVSGVNQADFIPTGTIAANQTLKIATAYKVNDFAACGNAGTTLTDTSGTTPVVNTMGIGVLSSQLNGTIKKLAFYPARLTNAQLQALTTV